MERSNKKEKKEMSNKIVKTQNGYFYTEEYLKSLTIDEILNLMIKEKSLQHTINAVRHEVNKNN